MNGRRTWHDDRSGHRHLFSIIPRAALQGFESRQRSHRLFLRGTITLTIVARVGADARVLRGAVASWDTVSYSGLIDLV
jgi:hypothetical protein